MWPGEKRTSRLHAPDCEPIAISEQAIPLGAIRGQRVREIVDVLPEPLDLDYTLTNPGRCTRLLANVCGRGQMIGVGVGVEDPGHV